MFNIPIIFFKQIKSVGGPTSFQIKFINWLIKEKINFQFLNIKNIFKKKILFINSGTFNLPLLLLSKFFNTRLIQRLDGFYDFSDIGRKSRNLRCFFINASMQFIRRYLADHIIYQSSTSKKLWDKNFKRVTTSHSIIHNPSFGFYSNLKRSYNNKNNFNLVIVEGNIEDNFYNNKILDLIFNSVIKIKKINKIYIFGNINNSLKNKLSKKNIFIIKNVVSHKSLKKFYKKNNVIFFGIEFNPCCSNSIIEANSFGIPSITLNTGSYKELIDNSGIQIDFKDINDQDLNKKFFNSLLEITTNYKKYSKLSFKNSIKFDPDYIFNKYINCFKKIH